MLWYVMHVLNTKQNPFIYFHFHCGDPGVKMMRVSNFNDKANDDLNSKYRVSISVTHIMFLGIHYPSATIALAHI